MIIMMMVPLFGTLHNEGRDASLGNDNSERREMREMVMKGCCDLSIDTCHAVVLIDVLCACLIAHSDPKTRNQLLVLIIKNHQNLNKEKLRNN